MKVINGVLLPFMALALLYVLNNEKFMARAPQTITANLFMLFTVGVCIMLACIVVIGKTRESAGFPSAETNEISAAFEINMSLGLTCIAMVGNHFSSEIFYNTRMWPLPPHAPTLPLLHVHVTYTQ